MFSLKFHILTCVWLCSTTIAYSARILGLFTFEARSHFGFHETMMGHLLAAGHRVTMIAPFTPQNVHPNLTNIDSSAGKARDLKNFDIMFVETMPMYHCFLPIAKKLRIPVIATMSARSLISADRSVGNARIPSVFPTEPFYLNTKMAFYDRLRNALNEMLVRIADTIEERRMKKFYEKHFAGVDMHGVKVSLLFVNNHNSLMPRSTVPNAVNVGGMQIKSATLHPLSPELKIFIEESEHGVILFSLGSIATNEALEPRLRNIFRKTFAQIPQRVIWKYDGRIADLSDNVILSKWLPQKEILAHKNVVAFITHCGLNSVYEAIHFAKPMILVPIFADQPGNAAILNSLEVGLYLNIATLDEVELLEALNEIVNTTKYRTNVRTLSDRFNDEPQSPGELVVYWTEYVLRYSGALHLRSPAADIPSYQYLLLDVIAFVIIVTILGVYFIFFVGRYVLAKVVFEKGEKRYHVAKEKRS